MTSKQPGLCYLHAVVDFLPEALGINSACVSLSLIMVFVTCSGWAKFADWGQVQSINNLAGLVSWWFGLALWITSINWVRRRWYSVSAIAILLSLHHTAQHHLY